MAKRAAASTEPRKTKAKIAHFGITGPDFTRLARDFMLSDSPARAYRLLVAGLRGSDGASISTADVASILDGAKCLTGDSGDDSGLKLELDTHSAGYRKQLCWLYAGRVRIDGAWYRPHAEVLGAGSPALRRAFDTAYGSHDPKDVEAGQNALRSFAKAIVAEFAAEGDRVVRVQRGGRTAGGYVIFTPVSEPPVWMAELRTPDEALADFLVAGRKLRQERWERPDKAVEQVVKAMAAGEVEPGPAAIMDVDRFEEDAAWDAERAAARAAARVAQEKAADAAEAEREVARAGRLEEIRAKVVEQAGNDFFFLNLPDREVRVPRAPFEQWALRRTSLAHLAAPWVSVAKSGWKLPLDDENHTDWMVGAGLPLEESYSGPAYDAAIHAMSELQERLGNFECAVLGGDHAVTGVVGKEIVVLPDLHPDRIEVMNSAKGVITAEGGQAAHLAQVALERGIPMMRVAGAVAMFPVGTMVSLYPAEGRVHIWLRHD